MYKNLIAEKHLFYSQVKERLWRSERKLILEDLARGGKGIALGKNNENQEGIIKWNDDEGVND